MVTATMTDDTPWQASVQHSVKFDDPLLHCLVLLTKLQHRPFSAEALSAGLPLQNNRFTPELFIRAAKRADLSAQLIKRSLTQFSKLSLPSVLLLNDGQACIFLQKVGKKTAQILLPESGEGTVELSLQELASHYTGYALFVRPIYQFDKRTEEDSIPRPYHWFWGSLSQSWHLYGEVLIASLLINCFALASPLFIMNVYDRVVPNHAIETLWVLALGVVTVFIFDFLMRTLRGYFIDIASKKSDILLSSLIFEQVLGTKRTAHPRSVGAFANHFHEFETFRDFFTSATLTTLLDLPFSLLFILVIWLIHPELAIIPLAAIPIVILFSALIQFPLRRVIEKTFRAGAQKHAVLIETLSSIETIKALRAEGSLQYRWEQLVGQISQSSLKSRFLSALSVNFSTFVQQMTTVTMVVAGVYLIADNQLTTGGLVACTILTGRALVPLGQIASLLTRYHQSVAAFKAINHIMQMPLERPMGQTFLHRPQLQGNIEFKQVSFTYPDQSLPTLTQLSFTIQAGERIGIIGRIGSGKSTVAKLLLQFYQQNEGSVLIDGIDSRQIDPADLRRNMGYMPQEPELFFGTIKDNIMLGAPYVEDSVVLKAAQLAGVDEFANRHPSGFDRSIGERGEGLSGGQRQAVVLARALLLNPHILILDEPTNAMDNSLEEQFKQRLQHYLTDKTLILVTHRMSLLSLVNRLIVLDNGRVVADGPKDQVIQALTSGRVKSSG